MARGIRNPEPRAGRKVAKYRGIRNRFEGSVCPYRRESVPETGLGTLHLDESTNHGGARIDSTLSWYLEPGPPAAIVVSGTESSKPLSWYREPAVAHGYRGFRNDMGRGFRNHSHVVSGTESRGIGNRDSLKRLSSQTLAPRILGLTV